MEVSSVAVGIASVAAIVLAIYAGTHIAIALGLISFVGVLLLRGDLDVALNLLSLAMADSIADEAFATVPAFVMMGLVVSRAGLGRDLYDFANDLFRPVRGGLENRLAGQPLPLDRLVERQRSEDLRRLGARRRRPRSRRSRRTPPGQWRPRH